MKLTLKDRKGLSVELPLAPESIDVSVKGEYSELPVLYTPQPQVKYKYSSSSFVLPKIVLRDRAYEILSTLTKWVSSGEELTYAYGSSVITRCHLSTLEYKELQWRNGKCTQSEASLTVLILPDKLVENKKAPSKVLSAREKLK